MSGIYSPELISAAICIGNAARGFAFAVGGTGDMTHNPHVTSAMESLKRGVEALGFDLVPRKPAEQETAA